MIERREYDIIEKVRKDLHEFFSDDPQVIRFTQPLWTLTHKREYLHGDLQDELDNERSKK